LNEFISSNIELECQKAQLRENMYAFLASVYLQPVSADLLRQVYDGSLVNGLRELFEEDAVKGMRGYSHSLKSKTIDQEAIELKQAYMNLFAVPTGSYVTPFEDIYRGRSIDGQTHRGPLLGVRAIAAKRIYREAGAQMDGLCKELPTHIGVELSFMRFLCAQEALSLGKELGENESKESSDGIPSQAEVYRGYQLRFLAEHLMHWFPQLNDEIQNKSSHVFYKALAQITQEFLVKDFEILKQNIVITAAKKDRRFQAVH
jgi:TorA maturation chaperone TorD